MDPNEKKNEGAKKPLTQPEVELSDDDLDKVAGGGGFFTCPDPQR